MAGSDSQKQLFTLIRDFSTEKSQGERRIGNQKKRIEELRSELDASNAELEKAKRDKETAEQQLKGYEVELSMNEASIQALEARIALTNNEISNLGAELAALKSEENSSRDGFIKQMLELNSQIRKFQELLPSMGNCSEATLNDGPLPALEQDPQQSRVVLQNKLAEIVLLTEQRKEQYEAEQVIHYQVQQELINLKKKAALLESVMKENVELQEMSRQTSELEGKFAALGDELQKRVLCPRCHHDNSEELGEILQISNLLVLDGYGCVELHCLNQTLRPQYDTRTFENFSPRHMTAYENFQKNRFSYSPKCGKELTSYTIELKSRFWFIHQSQLHFFVFLIKNIFSQILISPHTFQVTKHYFTIITSHQLSSLHFHLIFDQTRHHFFFQIFLYHYFLFKIEIKKMTNRGRTCEGRVCAYMKLFSSNTALEVITSFFYQINKSAYLIDIFSRYILCF